MSTTQLWDEERILQVILTASGGRRADVQD